VDSAHTFFDAWWIPLRGIHPTFLGGLENGKETLANVKQMLKQVQLN